MSARKSPLRPQLRKHFLICVIALAAWSFFLWRGITVFKPGVASLQYYNSDGAIPVLMSNEERPLTPFNLYYYGSDRWGAWPFLIAQAVSGATGFRWSDISVSTFQIIWIFLGVFAIAALSPKDYPVIGAVFLLTLLLHGETRYQIFWLSQVYAWQLTAILISWYFLRKLITTWCESDNPRLWPVWIVLTFAFSYLAIWSSGASVLFLLFAATVELAKVRLQSDVELSARRWLKAAGVAFGAVAAAAALEPVQRGFFYSYALEHFGSDFSVSSHFRLDTGHLSANLAAQLGKLIDLAWWPLELIAAIAFVAGFTIVALTLSKKHQRWGRLFEPVLSDNTFWVILGASGIALINFILTVLVAHVRMNQYEDRYLTFTSILGPVSGLLVLYLIVKLWARRTRLKEFTMPVITAAVIALTFVRFPAPGFRHEYQKYNQIASMLEQRAPRAILLGDYWGTYVFAALQHVSPMTPVPIEGQENRMPWTREMVRDAKEVIVEYRRSKLAESGPPPATLVQYGSTFRLVDPQVYQDSDFAFAKYVRENSLP